MLTIFFRLFWNLGLKHSENVSFLSDISFELKPKSGDAVVWPEEDKTLLTPKGFYPRGDTHFEELSKVGNYTFTLKLGDKELFSQGSQNSLILIFTRQCPLLGHILAASEGLRDRGYPGSTLGVKPRVRGLFQGDLSEKK